MGLSYIGLRSLLVSRWREWIAARHFVSVCRPKHSSSQRQGERQDPVKGGVPHCHCCTMSPHSTPLLASRLSPLSFFSDCFQIIIFGFRYLLPFLSSRVERPTPDYTEPAVPRPPIFHLPPSLTPHDMRCHLQECTTPTLTPHYATNLVLTPKILIAKGSKIQCRDATRPRDKKLGFPAKKLTLNSRPHRPAQTSRPKNFQTLPKTP